MQTTLHNRLTFGSLMLAGLLGLLWLDQKAEGWTFPCYVAASGRYGLRGLGILTILWLAMPLAIVELAALFAAEQVRPYRVLAAMGSGVIILHGFLTQFPWFQPIAASSFAFIIVVVMLLAALRRAMVRQSQGAIVAMAGTVLAMLYLGGAGVVFDIAAGEALGRF